MRTFAMIILALMFTFSAVAAPEIPEAVRTLVPETAAVTDNPMADNPFEGWVVQLAPGTEITVLAAYGDWLYVQCELEDTPARVFIKADTVF